MKRRFSAKYVNKQNKLKNTTTNFPEKCEINAKVRGIPKLKIKFKLPVFYSVD